jgi:hypothetical protein
MRRLRPRSTRFMQRQSRMGRGRQKARVGFARRRIDLNRKAAAFANAIARKWCHSRMRTVSTLDLNPVRRWRTPTPYHFSASFMVHRYVLSRSRAEAGWAHVVRPAFQGFAPAVSRRAGEVPFVSDSERRGGQAVRRQSLATVVRTSDATIAGHRKATSRRHGKRTMKRRGGQAVRRQSLATVVRTSDATIAGRRKATSRQHGKRTIRRAVAAARRVSPRSQPSPPVGPAPPIGHAATSRMTSRPDLRSRLMPSSRVPGRLPARAGASLSPVAREVGREGSPQVAPVESSLDAVFAPRPPIRPKLQRTFIESTLSDLEKNITAKIEKRIDGRITEAVEKTLSVDNVYSRKMSDAFFTALYDRMVLEKERLG